MVEILCGAATPWRASHMEEPQGARGGEEPGENAHIRVTGPAAPASTGEWTVASERKREGKCWAVRAVGAGCRGVYLASAETQVKPR
jgi:hypothetical protein